MIELPCDTAAEAGALACVLCASNGQSEEFLDQLVEQHFHDIRHVEIFRMLLGLQLSEEPLDVVALTQRLKDTKRLGAAGGVAYLTTLPDQTPSPLNFPTFLTVIKDRAARRKLVLEAELLNARAVDTSIPIAAELDNPNDWRNLVCKGTDTLLESVPNPEELIAGLVTECSKCVIGGSSKSFKTWFSLDAAVCLASGLPFLGRATNPLPVLYVNLELKERTLKKRIKTIVEAKQAAGNVVNFGNFRHITLRGKLAGLSVHEVIDRFLRLVASIKARVLFLDPIYKLNTEGDENSSRDQTKLFNELDRITTEGQATLILNDHFSKGSQSDKDPLDAIRGSSAKGGDVDAAIIIRAHETKFSYTVDVIHRELPPVEPFVISWKYPLFQIDEALDPSALKQPRRGRPTGFDALAVLTAIADSTTQNAYSRNAWAKKAGVASSTLQSHLASFRSKGWIYTVGEGNTAKSVITPKGLALCNSTLPT